MRTNLKSVHAILHHLHNHVVFYFPCILRFFRVSLFYCKITPWKQESVGRRLSSCCQTLYVKNSSSRFYRVQRFSLIFLKTEQRRKRNERHNNNDGVLKICLGVQHLELFKLFLPFCISEQDNFNPPDILKGYQECILCIFSRRAQDCMKILQR